MSTNSSSFALGFGGVVGSSSYSFALGFGGDVIESSSSFALGFGVVGSSSLSFVLGFGSEETKTISVQSTLLFNIKESETHGSFDYNTISMQRPGLTPQKPKDAIVAEEHTTLPKPKTNENEEPTTPKPKAKEDEFVTHLW